MKSVRQMEKDGQMETSREALLGGWRRILLLLILVLLALFAYLYYFTDLIKNHGATQQAVTTGRKPLPRKGGALGVSSSSVTGVQAGVSSAKQGVKPLPAAPKGGAVVPPKPVPVAPQIPKQAPQAAPAPKPVAATAEQPKKGAPPQQKSVVPPLPAAAVAPKKLIPVVAPPAPVAVAKPQPPAPAVTPSAKAAPGEVGGKGSYAVHCGPFVTLQELGAARGVLKREGLTPLLIHGPRRPTIMYRLYVATFPDAPAAAVELHKVQAAAPGAFVLPLNDAHELFAGSYHEEKGAKQEQERLSAKGIKVELRQVTTPVATRLLTAGAFPTREAASPLVARLKKEGIPCSIARHR